MVSDECRGLTLTLDPAAFVDDTSSNIALGTSMLPIPSDIGTAVSSACAANHCAGAWAESDMPRFGQFMEPAAGLERNGHRSNDHDRVAGGAPSDGRVGSPSTISLPSSPSSCAGSVRSTGERRQLLESESVDSLRSVNEIIRAANLRRVSTPQGMTLQFLQDALDAENVDGGPSLRSLLQEVPGTDELARRLSQLPDLWRTTILQMLEQAEQVQKGVEEMSEQETTRLAQLYAK